MSFSQLFWGLTLRDLNSYLGRELVKSRGAVTEPALSGREAVPCLQHAVTLAAKQESKTSTLKQVILRPSFDVRLRPLAFEARQTLTRTGGIAA